MYVGFQLIDFLRYYFSLNGIVKINGQISFSKKLRFYSNPSTPYNTWRYNKLEGFICINNF